MPDYTIKIDFTSDDDKVLHYVVTGLRKMRELFINAAGEIGDGIYGGSYNQDKTNAVKKIKLASARLAELAAKIEDIDLTMAQIAEDRPNVAKG